MVWFAAGIIFVAVVSVGGYLLYRWLDSRFGQAPDRPTTTVPAAIEPLASTDRSEEEGLPTETAEEPEGAPDTPNERLQAERPQQTEAPRKTPVRATSAEIAVPRTTVPEPTRQAPPPRESTQDAAPQPPAAEPPSEPEAGEPSVAAFSGEPLAEEGASATQEITAPADAPVVLPGSTNDVREGDLVAPGPGVVGPVVTKAVEPIYPPLSANMGREGTAMFSVLVGPDGEVEVVKLIVSTGTEPLDKSAEDAAWQTEFRPATKNGIKVRMWKTLRFQFKKTRGF